MIWSKKWRKWQLQSVYNENTICPTVCPVRNVRHNGERAAASFKTLAMSLPLSFFSGSAKPYTKWKKTVTGKKWRVQLGDWQHLWRIRGLLRTDHILWRTRRYVTHMDMLNPYSITARRKWFGLLGFDAIISETKGYWPGTNIWWMTAKVSELLHVFFLSAGGFCGLWCLILCKVLVLAKQVYYQVNLRHVGFHLASSFWVCGTYCRSLLTVRKSCSKVLFWSLCYIIGCVCAGVVLMWDWSR